MKANLPIRGIFSILILCLSSFTLTYAQKYNIDWVKSIGGDDTERSKGMAMDKNGNMYIVGEFKSDPLDFDPGGGMENLDSDDRPTAFIAKYDSSGNFIWARNLIVDMPGGSNIGGQSIANAIALDSNANVYVTGNFMGTVDFDPGSGKFNLTSNGNNDIFVLKLDSAGNFIWAKNIGGSANDQAVSLALDKHSNIYIAGHSMSPNIDFNPGVGANISNSTTNWIFVLKLDNDGNYIWVKNSLAAKKNSIFHIAIAQSMTIDSSNNILITGRFNGSVDFNPEGTGGLLTGKQEIFVLKLKDNSDFVWVKYFSRVSSANALDYGDVIQVDAIGDIYVAGMFGVGGNAVDSTDFDPGAGSYILEAKGEATAYIVKLSSDGDFVWAKAFGGLMYNHANSLFIDNLSGYIYLSGYFSSISTSSSSTAEVDFNPGGKSFFLSGKLGTYYQYLSILTTTGDFVWAKRIGPERLNPPSDDDIISTAMNRSGSIYMTGIFNNTQPGSVIFDTDPDTLKLNYRGSSFNDLDFYFLKINRCIIKDTFEVNTCSSYTFGNKTYVESGIYADTIINLSQCDSVITLNLTLGEDSQDTLEVSTCDSFTFNGEIYGRSGVYTHVFQTALECDSTVILLLDVSGTKPDTSIIRSGKTTLTALEDDATYQWLDCDNDYKPVPSATNQSFTPTVDGNYALKVSSGEYCTDTSACYGLKGVSDITSLNADKSIKVYPNPIIGTVQIITDGIIINGCLRLYDASGRLMTELSGLNGSSFELDMQLYSPGLYIMEIEASEITTRMKLQKL